MKYVEPIRDMEKLEEIKNVLRDRSERDWFLFNFGINTGLRISDILPLKVGDVRGKTHILIDQEEKTKKRKKTFLNSTIRKTIEEYTAGKDDDDFLFPSQRSKKNHIDRVQAYRVLNKAAEIVGISEIGTHTMRKTFGYHHYKKCKDVALLQEMFNYSAPSVTLRYIGISQDKMDESLYDFGL